MRARRPIPLAAVVALAACTVAQDGEQIVGQVQGILGAAAWRCADGSSFLTQYDSVLQTLVYQPGERNVTLRPTPAPMGERFANDYGYVFLVTGREATLTRPGGLTTSCTRTN